MRLFVFGIGYSAGACLSELKPHCEWIGGTTRSDEKASSLSAGGIEPFVFDGITPSAQIASAVDNATHILVSIAPGEQGDPVLGAFGNTLKRFDGEWIGYLSTVGVYGNHDGAWVNEETECRPVSKRSRWRFDAENAWLELARQTGVPTGIYRLSGIYGPGRNTFVNFQKGTARRLVKPDQVFNRIFVDDIAGAVAASIKTPATRIYNITDNEPAPPQDVVTLAAELLGVEPPAEIPFETADISPMARSFYGENKRVSNRRVREELGYTFKYPDYRMALQHLFENGWR
ncbi:MAG: SDR family oxidoreductase [Stappiaceae bacterium]